MRERVIATARAAKGPKEEGGDYDGTRILTLNARMYLFLSNDVQ